MEDDALHMAYASHRAAPTAPYCLPVTRSPTSMRDNYRAKFTADLTPWEQEELDLALELSVREQPSTYPSSYDSDSADIDFNVSHNNSIHDNTRNINNTRDIDYRAYQSADYETAIEFATQLSLAELPKHGGRRGVRGGGRTSGVRPGGRRDGRTDGGIRTGSGRTGSSLTDSSRTGSSGRTEEHAGDCSICLETLGFGSGRLTECSRCHQRFHAVCRSRWSSTRCPLCRVRPV